MKKSYETPSIEVVKFQYRDQVVVASGNIGTCDRIYRNDTGAYGSPCWTNEYLNDNR